jgi:putative ABC transport system substrate-binding protein
MHGASDPTFGAWGAQSVSEARMAGVEPVRIGLTAASPAAVAEGFKILAEAGATAMLVIRDYITAAMEEEICRVGIEGKVTLIGQASEFARAGALFSYGADGTDLFRRAATYVDLILKGQKPAEMPIQLPTKFELVVNMKTARALGVSIPSTLLVMTDELIE